MKFNYDWKLSDGYPAPGIKKHESKVFSCFACGGGSTMGYKLAGYDVIGCNEIDPKMMEAYKVNHNPTYSFLEPIQEFKDREDLPKELYELDVLDGSPPCSSFSMAGNRGKDWGKKKKFREGQAEQILDTLFFDFIDLAKRLQPKIVIAENVKGLLQGDARQYLKKVYDELKAAGYYVQHFLLDASKMGVPQRRERVFIIGLRKDLAEPFLKKVDFFHKLPELILDFNEDVIPFKEINEGDVEGELKFYPSIDEMWDRHEPGQEWYRTTGSKAISHYKPKKNEVLKTMIASDTAGPYHPEYKRSLSKNEYCKASSFPLDYNFIDNSSKYITGMSVPPVMMAQIAHEIYKQWISKI